MCDMKPHAAVEVRGQLTPIASSLPGCDVSWPREELHRRIDARVEQMFAAGLVEEVRGLLATYGTLSRTAVQAVGYREVIEYLSGQGTGDRGQGTGDRKHQPALLAECIERVEARTRQFARRQETWFRALSECTFVPMQSDVGPSRVAKMIVDLGAARIPHRPQSS